MKRYDLLVIGGGVNGSGIARDAAGRGLSVCLAECGDIGGATSSASTKLIHGGLRYLEHYEFGLVRKALKEREVILRNAPHITWPQRFVLPHDEGVRPAWMIRAGLFLYDHLARRKRVPGSGSVNLKTDPAGQGLAPRLTRGFTYWDGWVQDNRLVVLNLVDAKERGADIRTRTRAVTAREADGAWQVTLRDEETGGEDTVSAGAVVNAAGPWAEAVARGVFGRNDARAPRLVQGSHIVTRRLFAHDDAYMFQNEDGRIIFALPYEQDFTLIGTTDRNFEGEPREVSISQEETDYLLDAVNRCLAEPVSRQDIAWTYSGVRPLYGAEAEEAAKLSRDYELDLVTAAPPLLDILGGKLTTYRVLALEALEKLEPHLPPMAPEWTHEAPLPGGDFADFEDALLAFRKDRPWLPEAIARRYLRDYGTRAARITKGAVSLSDLGRDFGSGIHEAELRYVRDHEFARSGADFLWRRSKRGLHSDEATRAAVTEWFSRETIPA
ncbi:glycerol-3-phosphate dehydrogenase [Parvularcula oceani]|uniref:glycerol-3-phosphate dehydrogenase n=1 Tax=Parvularcula oceani TaxID=1247963 RepID=UPI0004E1673F|nr:glycerol-3-phosphate dehydrogenase [Parvularcula oceani]